jgi:hypothetical protein
MNRPDKGKIHGSCNVTACQRPGATWFNTSTRAYYCEPCARDITDFTKRADGFHICFPTSGDPTKDALMKFGEEPAHPATPTDLLGATGAEPKASELKAEAATADLVDEMRELVPLDVADEDLAAEEWALKRAADTITDLLAKLAAAEEEAAQWKASALAADEWARDSDAKWLKAEARAQAAEEEGVAEAVQALEAAKSLMMGSSGGWKNPAGYTTDAALWIDRAISTLHRSSLGFASAPVEPRAGGTAEGGKP